MQRRFLQLDVFSERAGQGNPLAVVADCEDLDSAAMQAIASWLNLSETVFLLPPDEGASYRVRIFTPLQELPFAGHPSVGAAWAAVELGLAEPDEERTLVQQCAAGLLPVRVVGSRWFRQLHVRSPQARRLDTALDALPPGLAALAHPDTPPALWNNCPARASWPSTRPPTVRMWVTSTWYAPLPPGSGSTRTRSPAAPTPWSPRHCWKPGH